MSRRVMWYLFQSVTVQITDVNLNSWTFTLHTQTENIDATVCTWRNSEKRLWNAPQIINGRCDAVRDTVGTQLNGKELCHHFPAAIVQAVTNAELFNCHQLVPLIKTDYPLSCFSHSGRLFTPTHIPICPRKRTRKLKAPSLQALQTLRTHPTDFSPFPRAGKYAEINKVESCGNARKRSAAWSSCKKSNCCPYSLDRTSTSEKREKILTFPWCWPSMRLAEAVE